MVIGLPGEVGEHGRAGQRGIGTRWDRHPHVLADLHEQGEPGDIGRPEDQVAAERHALAAHRDGLAALVLPRGEPAGLVELPIGREERLGRHPEDLAAVDHHRTVVDPVALAQWGSDDEHGTQVGARLDDRRDRPVDRLEQRVLQEQVVDRVAGQAQLGEERHRDALVVTAARLGKDRLRVGGGVGDRDRQGAGGDPREPVRVGRFEVHTHSVTEQVPAEWAVCTHPSHGPPSRRTPQ